MTSTKIAYSAGNFFISIDSSAGNVHTTNTHIIPVWYFLVALAVLVGLIWIYRSRKNPNDDTTAASR